VRRCATGRFGRRCWRGARRRRRRTCRRSCRWR
jgi:hypothetical protein